MRVAATERQSSKHQASACEKACGDDELMASRSCKKIGATGDLKQAAQPAAAEQPMEVDKDPIGAAASQQPLYGPESAPALLAAAIGSSALTKTARSSPAGSPGGSRKPDIGDGMQPGEADCAAAELDGGQAPSADGVPGINRERESATPARVPVEPNAGMHAAKGHAADQEMRHETAAGAGAGAETAAAEALTEAQRRSVMDVLVDARWLAAAALPRQPPSQAAYSPLALLAAQASLAKKLDIKVLLSLKKQRCRCIWSMLIEMG